MSQRYYIKPYDRRESKREKVFIYFLIAGIIYIIFYFFFFKDINKDYMVKNNHPTVTISQPSPTNIQPTITISQPSITPTKSPRI